MQLFPFPTPRLVLSLAIGSLVCSHAHFAWGNLCVVLASASREARSPGFRLKSNGEPTVRPKDAAGLCLEPAGKCLWVLWTPWIALGSEFQLPSECLATCTPERMSPLPACVLSTHLKSHLQPAFSICVPLGPDSVYQVDRNCGSWGPAAWLYGAFQFH